MKNARPFLTSPSEEAAGPTLPVLPAFPLAETIEGDEVPPSAPILTT